VIVVFLAVTPARMVRITSSKDKNVQIPGRVCCVSVPLQIFLLEIYCHLKINLVKLCTRVSLNKFVVSRTGRTDYQLLLMKASDRGRNIKFLGNNFGCV